MKSTGKKIKKFKYKRVKIYWQDIVSNPEWMTLNKAKDQVYSWCEDTGYLLFKDSRRVIIFASHSFDDDGELTVGNITVYPRGVVKRLRTTMTYTGMFEDAQLSSKLKEAKKEIQRQKRYIEKQSGIILALEKDIELKDNIILVLKNKQKK